MIVFTVRQQQLIISGAIGQDPVPVHRPHHICDLFAIISRSIQTTHDGTHTGSGNIIHIDPRRIDRHQQSDMSDSLRSSTAESEPNSGSLALLRSEEHTSELQSRGQLVRRRLLEKKKKQYTSYSNEQ